MSNWTQPLCERCWFSERPDEIPTRFIGQCTVERCCMCGLETIAGIFVRRDPATVPFPDGEDEDDY